MPKNIEYNFLINFDECDKLFNQLSKVKLKKGDYDRETIKTKSKSFADAYLKFKEQYKNSNWGSYDTFLSANDLKNYAIHWRNMYNGFNYMSNVLEQHGVSKTLALKFKYAACNFRDSAHKAVIYRGSEIPTVETLMSNEYISSTARTNTEFLANNTAIENLFNAVSSNDSNNPKHKNSKEFQNLLLRITELKNKFAAVKKDGKYKENSDKALEKEDAIAIGKCMDKLKKAADAYINAKGGIGNQYTQMGKDRMAMAVEAVAFVSENQAFYPSNTRILAHANHVVENEYPSKETKEARNEISRINQLVKDGQETVEKRDYGYIEFDNSEINNNYDLNISEANMDDFFEK